MQEEVNRDDLHQDTFKLYQDSTSLQHFSYGPDISLHFMFIP